MAEKKILIKKLKQLDKDRINIGPELAIRRLIQILIKHFKEEEGR